MVVISLSTESFIVNNSTQAIPAVSVSGTKTTVSKLIQFFLYQYFLDWVRVIIEVWLCGSEPTIIRRFALVQQLSVRKDPRSNFTAYSKTKLLLLIYM